MQMAVIQMPPIGITNHTSCGDEVERFIRGGYDTLGMKTKNTKDIRKLLWHGVVLVAFSAKARRLLLQKHRPTAKYWGMECILPTRPASPGHTMILEILIRLTCCLGLEIRLTLGRAMRTNL